MKRIVRSAGGDTTELAIRPDMPQPDALRSYEVESFRRTARDYHEAIEWAVRCPASEDDVIELRRVQEMSDFPDDVREAAKGFSEL